MQRSVLAGLAATAAAMAPMAAHAQYQPQPYQQPAYQQQGYQQQGYQQQGYGQSTGAYAGANAGVATGSPLSSIFNCAAGGNKQTGGAAIGGVIGGLLGSQVAKNERTLGTVIGAAAGAALGSYVGCRLQTQDQQRALAATNQALAQGSNTSWSNPQTGASGSVNVLSSEGGYAQASSSGYGQPSYNAQPVSLAGLRVARNVQLQTQLETSPANVYTARSTANLRAGPSTSTAVVGKLRAGEQLDGLARVRGQNWILVGRNGTGIGYVSESVVRPVGPATQTYASASTSASASTQNLCRVIEQTINVPGAGPTVERYRACQQANGEWNVARA